MAIDRIYPFTDDPQPFVDDNLGGRWSLEKKVKYAALGSSFTFTYEPRPEYVRHGMMPGSHERSSGPECRCGGVWDVFSERCSRPWHEMKVTYAGFHCICGEWKIGSWNGAREMFARHLQSTVPEVSEEET